MVNRVRRFNGDKVPSYLEAYNAKMVARDVDEALRLDFFCRVVAVQMHSEVRELRKAHNLWEAFEEALLEAYRGERPKGQVRHNFDQSVGSAKTHRAMKAFLEFERRLARLPKREQRMVGVDKVFLYVVVY